MHMGGHWGINVPPKTGQLTQGCAEHGCPPLLSKMHIFVNPWWQWICIIITAVLTTPIKEQNTVYLCRITDSNISVSYAFGMPENFLIQFVLLLHTPCRLPSWTFSGQLHLSEWYPKAHLVHIHFLILVPSITTPKDAHKRLGCRFILALTLQSSLVYIGKIFASRLQENQVSLLHSYQT